MSAITVGLDGSPESLAAADWAAREAAQRDVSLCLVHADDPPRPMYVPYAGFPALDVLDVQRTWAADLLREAETRIAGRHPGLRITSRLVQEQAVPALLTAAEDGELLVLGSRGLGTLPGFIVGSVALALVARAERPVVLVRAGERAEDEHLPDATGAGSITTPNRDIVLGLDVENPDDAVIEFAFETARRRVAGLRVVHGWTQAASYGYGAALDAGLNLELAEEIRKGLVDVLRPWQDKFPSVEVSAQTVVGGAGRHLVHASRDAALVVVGRKRRQASVGGRIGPVTHAVLQHASAPVAVVPHD
ncbi:universal stress protein [Streptomyces sasae]|uniref:universal stress protein n=1 Tax=Streptomyces sasae TaxID=1266772 RepID=UPI0029308533|nr:universal stress protein [Streptomyces sasae]